MNAARGILAVLALLVVTGIAPAQEAEAPAEQQGARIRFEVRFSRPLAEFVFLRQLAAKAPTNPFQGAFTGSKFDTPENREQVTAFNAIPLDYEYEFHEYPFGQKFGGSILFSLKRNLVLSDSLSEFRMLSIGLVPLCDLNRLVDVMERLAPVYDELVYEPARTALEQQLKDIEELVTSKDIGQYFEQARVFYRSSWDPSIPFLFVFYPLPSSRGFNATAYGNVAECALPTSYSEYIGVLSVMLHEATHILSDEQSLEFKKELEDWFTSNPSRYSRLARGLMEESWATAVANGYFQEKLSGKLNPGSWYNWKYNDLMAKQLYPLFKEYLENGEPIDRPLIDEYVAIYESEFPGWISEWDNLLTGRYVISENPADFDLLATRFPYCPLSKYLPDFSERSFERLQESTTTKLVVVAGDNERKLDLVRSHFHDLESWRPDPKQDFVHARLLSDRTPLIVVNLVNGSLEKVFESKLEMH